MTGLLPPGTKCLIIDAERVLPVGHQQVLVESKSHPGEWHTVSREFNDQNGLDELVCTCRGFEIRHACRHVRVIDRWNAGKATTVLFEGEETDDDA